MALHNAFYVRWRAGYGWVTQAPRPLFAEMQELIRSRAFDEPKLGEPHSVESVVRGGVLFVGFVGTSVDAKGRPVRHHHVVAAPHAAPTPDNKRRLIDALRDRYGEAGDGVLESITRRLSSGQPADGRVLLEQLEIHAELTHFDLPGAGEPEVEAEADDPLVEHTAVLPAVDVSGAPTPRIPTDRLPPSPPPHDDVDDDEDLELDEDTVLPVPTTISSMPVLAASGRSWSETEEPPRPRSLAMPVLVLVVGVVVLFFLAGALLLGDLDGDGHRARMLFGDDCDDLRADVHPGVQEQPADGIDGDCDGFENCFADLDGDGAGAATLQRSVSLQCQGRGIARSSNDCDDADATRYPGAPEVAGDSIDQDCDGSDACYVDDDGDGFGVDARLVPADGCRATGLVASGGDCDDGDPDRHPDAAATGDGVDRDCDGVVSEAEARPPSCGPGAPSQVWHDSNRNGVRDCLEAEPEESLSLVDATLAEQLDPVRFRADLTAGGCDAVVLQWSHPGEAYTARRTTRFRGQHAECVLRTPGDSPAGRVCAGGARRGDRLEYRWLCAFQELDATSPGQMRELPLRSGMVDVLR